MTNEKLSAEKTMELKRLRVCSDHCIFSSFLVADMSLR